MKIQDKPKQMLPVSDWDKNLWTKDDYRKHEDEFKKTLLEYREFRTIDGPIDARWKWLESKDAVSLDYSKGYIEASLNQYSYRLFSNMFDRFTEWLCFNEIRDGIQLESLQKTLDKSNIARMPELIENEIIKSALDNF